MINPQSLNAPILSQITLSHGPVPLLGRTILTTDQLARRAGVTLSLVTGEDFLAANLTNADSWLPLLKLFDVRYNRLTRDNALFLLGRNASGEIVACQAARCYDWTGTNFGAEMESMRLFYSDPQSMKEPDESYRVTSNAAWGTRGRVVYSGGAWYRRDYRRKGLVEWLPRLARAYARGVWDVANTVTIMSEANVAKGVFPRNGYSNMEWAVHINNQAWGAVRYAYMWSKDEEMLQDLQTFLDTLADASGAQERIVGAE